MSRQVYIADAWRTPFCRAGGALARLSPQDLAVAVLRPLAERCKAVPDILDVHLGNVLNGRGNLARYALLGAGLPQSVPGSTVDRQCASGMDAVAQAFYRAHAELPGAVFVAGGVESMSQAPFLMSRPVRAFDRSPPAFISVPLSPPEIGDPSMIETAETVAREAGVDREAMDRFAARSHQRAVAAQQGGILSDEIVPVRAPDESGRAAVVAADVGPRPDTSVEKLAALRPVVATGTVTAGNASGIADGAAVTLIMDDTALSRHGMDPLARVSGVACTGVDPKRMGIGPVSAVQQLLGRRHLTLSDIGLWEINEAFAGQVLAVTHGLKIDPQAINIDGGAIALGHPLGASGARIVGHLARRMKADPSVRFGVATLCVGGGMGMALLLEQAS